MTKAELLRSARGFLLATAGLAIVFAGCAWLESNPVVAARTGYTIQALLLVVMIFACLGSLMAASATLYLVIRGLVRSAEYVPPVEPPWFEKYR